MTNIDEIQDLKIIIIQELGITEKELDKIVLNKKKELIKKLGKSGKIDELGTLQLVAQQNYGISTIPQQKISKKIKTTFQQFLDHRDNAREMFLYSWYNLKPEIDMLLMKIKQEDSVIYSSLQKADEFLSGIVIPSIFKNDDDWFQPKNVEELYAEDYQRMDSGPELLRKFFNKIYGGFLINTQYASIDDAKGLYSIHIQYLIEVKNIRYPNKGKNPYYNHELANNLASRRKYYDWTSSIGTSNELLQCFNGTLSQIDSMRNFGTHRDDVTTKSRFNKANRELKDPLTGTIESSGNFITLSNLFINAIYFYMELMQIWLDSTTIGKQSTGVKKTWNSEK